LVYIMSTMQINIKEARQRFSELVNTVALKREKIVITSRNKPKAVLVSVQDAEAMEGDAVRGTRRRMQLESIRRLRRRLAEMGVSGDSLRELERLREERLEGLSSDD
jgi:prevent-host-death family protein